MSRCAHTIMQLAVVILLMVFFGCSKDDPTAPNEGGGLKVLGVVDLNGDPPVTVLVVWNKQPVTNAQVTLNGEEVPFAGTITEDGCEDCTYDYYGVVEEPGTQYVLSVHTSHGDKTFTATMPADPIITSPVDGATFADNENIPVTWTAVPNATRMYVGLMPSYSIVGAKFDHLSGTATQSTISSSKTDPMDLSQEVMVGALNGQGEYYFEYLLSLDPPDGFYAVNWGNLFVTVEQR
jgi:hypothetical protein